MRWAVPTLHDCTADPSAATGGIPIRRPSPDCSCRSYNRVAAAAIDGVTTTRIAARLRRPLEPTRRGDPGRDGRTGGNATDEDRYVAEPVVGAPGHGQLVVARLDNLTLVDRHVLAGVGVQQ